MTTKKLKKVSKNSAKKKKVSNAKMSSGQFTVAKTNEVSTQPLKFSEATLLMSKSGNIHYRRCHICNELSESDDGRVLACGACGKVMAPFFFFEESETVTLSEFELRPIVSPSQHPPVRGLTAFW